MIYECNEKYHSNLGAFFSGGQAYLVRLFGILYVSQFLLDYYQDNNYISEIWATDKYAWHGGIEYDVHEPFTDAFN